MKNSETNRLPRLLATILLLVSLLMFVTLVDVTVTVARGGSVPPRTWLFPMTILAAGTVLTWLLTRKGIPLRLYLVAFVLWLITTGYYFSKLTFIF